MLAPPTAETTPTDQPVAPSSDAASITSVTSTPLTTLPVTSPATAPPRTVLDLAACVRSWPLRERVALLVWPAVYDRDWATAQRVVSDLGIGGVVLMKPSDSFAANLADSLADLDALSRHGLLVATDEEGGEVQRLAALGPIPSQADMSALGEEAIRTQVGSHAQVLAAAGIDVVFAPVVDVRAADGSDPLGDERLFLGGPDDVTRLAGAYTDAWLGAGILPVLKHFPGHGRASADTHQKLATTPSLDELRTWDLVPYRDLAGQGAGVMVGHLAVPGLTDGRPASLDRAAVTFLRTELGYGDALVVSDALGMGAVGLDVPTAAVRSLAAGVDVVIFTDTSQTGSVIDAIMRAVEAGSLTEAEIDDSAVRVAREIERSGGSCGKGPG